LKLGINKPSALNSLGKLTDSKQVNHPPDKSRRANENEHRQDRTSNSPDVNQTLEVDATRVDKPQVDTSRALANNTVSRTDSPLIKSHKRKILDGPTKKKDT